MESAASAEFDEVAVECAAGSGIAVVVVAAVAAALAPKAEQKR